MIYYKINSLSPELLENIFSAETEHESLEAIRYYAGSGGVYDLERDFDPVRANSNFLDFSEEKWNNIIERYEDLDENILGSHSSEHYSVHTSEMDQSGDTNHHVDPEGVSLPSAIDSPLPEVSSCKSNSILALESEPRTPLSVPDSSNIHCGLQTTPPMPPRVVPDMTDG